MDMQSHEHQAALQASRESVKGSLTKLEEAWVTSVGSLDAEMLEYHRSRHRDGSWRDAYGIPN
jgi:hypothetical protein